MQNEIKEYKIEATVTTFSYKTIDPKTMQTKTLYYMRIQDQTDREPLTISIGEKNHEAIKTLSQQQ